MCLLIQLNVQIVKIIFVINVFFSFLNKIKINALKIVPNFKNKKQTKLYTTIFNNVFLNANNFNLAVNNYLIIKKFNNIILFVITINKFVKIVN